MHKDGKLSPLRTVTPGCGAGEPTTLATIVPNTLPAAAPIAAPLVPRFFCRASAWIRRSRVSVAGDLRPAWRAEVESPQFAMRSAVLERGRINLASGAVSIRWDFEGIGHFSIAETFCECWVFGNRDDELEASAR